MKRRSGCIWIGAGVVLALLAGGLAFWAILNAVKVPPPEPKAPTVEVVVASRSIGVREVIASGDIEIRTAPAAIVPENALRNVNQAVGQLTLTSLSSGEMVLASHIISPTVKGGPVAFLMEESQVAMAFPAEDILTRNNLLKPGDHVDVLFSIEVTLGEEGGNLVTFNALQNLEVAAIPRATAEGGGAGKPLALVFTLDPQDALVLKHLQDMGGTVDIVLRAPEAEERFTTQPVHMNYLIDRYQLRVPELP